MKEADLVHEGERPQTLVHDGLHGAFEEASAGRLLPLFHHLVHVLLHMLEHKVERIVLADDFLELDDVFMC